MYDVIGLLKRCICHRVYKTKYDIFSTTSRFLFLFLPWTLFNTSNAFVLLEITEFEADKAFRGFTHENGRLKVQLCGFYCIYAQVFFEIHASGPTYHNRVALSVNGATFSLLQTGLQGMADYGSVFTGGVIQLHEGDFISLKTTYDSNLWVSRRHTFFGAYRIGE